MQQAKALPDASRCVIRTSDMNDVIERKEMVDRITVAEKMVKDLHKKNNALKELINKGKECTISSSELKKKQSELSELQKKNGITKIEIEKIEKETLKMEECLKVYDECMKEVIDNSKLFYCLTEEAKYVW